MATKTTSSCDFPSVLAVALPAIMTIETVEALAGELKQLPLAEKSSLTLDASAIESITTPGLQLIVSLERTLSAQGGTLTIQGGREGVRRIFAESGLSGLLGASS